MKKSGSAGSGLVVHEWLERAGGAEKVVDEFMELYPAADMFCVWNDHPGRYGDKPVRESWLARSPLRGRKALSVPVLPLVWAHTQFTEYEWVLVSSHLFAHHVATNRSLGGTPTYVYAHTPARYIWTPELDARGTSLAAKVASPFLRRIDQKQATGPSKVAANSEFVRRRIASTWERESEVIYPPVDSRRISQTREWRAHISPQEEDALKQLPESFLLGASRLVPYKRLDAVIRAGEISGLPVVIAGTGPDLPRLRTLAESSNVPVTFLGYVSDEMLFSLYQTAVAYVFPAVEDFGIMPVEAMATGTSVIATTVGGTAESVLHERTGFHCDFRSSSDLRHAIDAVDTVDAADCIARAATFDRSIFRGKIRAWMDAAC